MDSQLKAIYKVVIPGLIGNVLEWYDFALYGYLAVIITPLFFPMDDLNSAYLATYSVFAIGFFMRPLGAILFGYFGDRYGRKNALSAAILLMAIPTTLIGCLPTHQQIGLWAPILLTCCRLLQGLAVGGEFTGSIVYIVEHAPPERRGYFGSLAMASAFLGLLIGSLTAVIVHKYFDAVSYAWRVPFLFSLLLGGVGLYLRLGMPESPIFEAYIKEHRTQTFPLKQIIKQHWANVLKAVGLVMLPSAGFYLSFVYLPTYLDEYINYSIEGALFINTLTMFVIILLIPVCGALSDKFGRRIILWAGALGFLGLSVPLYGLVQQGQMLFVYCCMMTFALLVALSYSTIPVVLVELFPTELRFTGMSLPYNIANALFGGTAPLVATYLIGWQQGNLYMPGIYLSGIASVTLLTLLITRTKAAA